MERGFVRLQVWVYTGRRYLSVYARGRGRPEKEVSGITVDVTCRQKGSGLTFELGSFLKKVSGVLGVPDLTVVCT